MQRGDPSGAADEYRDAAARWAVLGETRRRDAATANATAQSIAAGVPLDAVITELVAQIDATADEPPSLPRVTLLTELARFTANVGDRFDASRRIDEATAALTALGYPDPSPDADAAYVVWSTRARQELSDWLYAVSSVLTSWQAVLSVRGAIGRGYATVDFAALGARLTADAGLPLDSTAQQVIAVGARLARLYDEYETGADEPDPVQWNRLRAEAQAIAVDAAALGQPQSVAMARVTEADLLNWAARYAEAIDVAAMGRAELAVATMAPIARTDMDIELIRRQVAAAASQRDSAAVSRFAGEAIAVVENDRARLQLPYLSDDYLRTRRQLYVAGIAAARNLEDYELMLARADLAKARGALAWLRGTPADVPEIRASLRADEAVVYHFWADREVLYVLTVTRAGMTCDRRLFTSAQRADLDSLVSDFYDPAQWPPVWADDELPALGEVLLPTDGADLLTAARHVYLSPNGITHQLPLHALRWRDGPLTATHAVSYVPNFASLSPRAVSVGTGRPLVIGVGAFPGAAGLAHTEDEARFVAARQQNADLLVGPAATVAAIDERRADGRLASAPLLHLATHGDDGPVDDPLAACFLLADGSVTGTAMRDWSLSADLVVLSACWSAQRAVVGRDGTEMFGDEVYGLQSAFFAAGTRQVLGAMWPASDRVASPLMQRFYDRLAAGASVPAALQDAMNAARAAPGALLYEWAPFKLTTIGRPATESPDGETP